MHGDQPPAAKLEPKRRDPLTNLNAANELVAALEARPDSHDARQRVRRVERLVREIDDSGFPLLPTERRRIARALGPIGITEPIVVGWMAQDLAERIPLCGGPDLADENAVVRFLTTNKIGEPYRLSTIEREIEAICERARALRQRGLAPFSPAR